MRSSFILIFTRAMRLSKTYSFSGNVVRKSRPRTQYFVLISMFLAPVSLYNGFSYRAYLSCFVERQDRQNLSFGAKMSRSKYSILCGRNVAHEGIDQQWVTKAVGPKHQFSFYYFFYKNDKGIWLKLSKKKVGWGNAIIMLHPPFLSQIPVNKGMIMIWNISLDHFVWANARYQSQMMQLLSTPKCLSKQLISYAVFYAVLFCILVWCF